MPRATCLFLSYNIVQTDSRRVLGCVNGGFAAKAVCQASTATGKDRPIAGIYAIRLMQNDPLLRQSENRSGIEVRKAGGLFDLASVIFKIVARN